MEGDDFVVGQTAASEDIEGAADGEVETAVAEIADEVEILHVPNAAGVGHGNPLPAAEKLDEAGLDTFALALDVGGVDEKFGTGVSQEVKVRGGDLDVGKLLPAVGDNPVAVTSAAAGKVEDKSIPPYEPDETRQPPFVDLSLTKDP